MANNTDTIVVIDYVEDADWEGKAYLRLVDKNGAEGRLGQHLQPKYDFVRSLQSGSPVKLTMATFNKSGETKEYVKDINTALNALADQIVDKLAPRRNTKDISIEAQKAVDCATNLITSGVVDVPEDIKELTYEWIRKSIKAGLE